MPTERVIRTLEEWDKMIAEAERDGEPMEKVTVTLDMTLSASEAAKLYKRAKEDGIHITGEPPSSSKKPRASSHRHRAKH